MTHLGENQVKTVAAKEAKQSFGRLLDDAQREPVRIERNGRPIAVVLSAVEYDRLEALEDAHWGERAMRAHTEGYLTEKETKELFKSVLDAKD